MPSPQRLYLIQVAWEPNMHMPIVCYLVQMDDGQNILIDTGLPEPDQLPPGVAPIMQPTVVEQLASIGLQPDDIDMLICTHFDLDHTGHHAAFMQAKWVVQQAHYEHALTNPRFQPTRQQWERPTEQYQFVNGDVELFPGLELLATDGHALGHQSVLVMLPEYGNVLLAIDAVMQEADFKPDRDAGPRDADPIAVRTSTQKLLDIAENDDVNLVVFGHDLDQWETLKKLPEFYS